ncbi:hypothetical protein HOL82_03510 [Candidatus Woesearchaeota archaeon]|nr:hypothetical protein [Candidatus Woesearchaeota archaeon]
MDTEDDRELECEDCQFACTGADAIRSYMRQTTSGRDLCVDCYNKRGQAQRLEQEQRDRRRQIRAEGRAK